MKKFLTLILTFGLLFAQRQSNVIRFTDGTSAVNAGDSANNAIRVVGVSGFSSGGDGAIVDGVSSSIKATVLDYTNSNPLAVRLTDTSGDYVSAGGGTEYTEDAISPADPVGKALMTTRDDQLSTVTEVEGDWSRLRSNSKGALWVTIPDSNGDPITSFGGGTQYTEDAAAAADPTGTMLMGVRADSLAAVTSTDGDNIAARFNNKGEIYVKHTDSIPVTDNGGSLTVDGTIAATQSGTWNITNISGTVSLPTGASTLAEQQTQTTALQLIDNSIHTEDEASADLHGGVGLLAVRKATPANTSGTDGDYEFLQMSAGRLWVDASGVTLTVGSHAVTNAGVFAVQVDAALPAGDNNIGNMDIVSMPSVTVGTFPDNEPFNLNQLAGTALAVPFDADSGAGTQNLIGVSIRKTASGGSVEAGTASDPLRIDPTGTTTQPISAASLPLPTGASTLAEQQTQTTALQLIDNVVHTEDEASADQHSGVFILARRTATPANQSGTDGDYEGLQLSAGRLWVSATIDAALPAGDNNFGNVDIVTLPNTALSTWGHVATGAAPPANGVYQVGISSGATGGLAVGAIYCDSYANIQQTANAQVITGVSGRRVYICEINVVTDTAQDVSIVAGTGTTCATTTVAVPGLAGGATAATGWNFAASSGIALGGGANAGPIAKTTVNGDNVCVFQSGSGQLSGGISYAIL